MEATTKIIARGFYWVCENMDLLAPIIETGMEYLLSDGTIRRVPDNVIEDDDPLATMEYATEADKKAFASQEYGTIFKGDTIVIKRGRKMVGETKVVKGYYRYDVPGTYGHQYTEYLLFTDGTKVNIQHCDVLGVDHKNVRYAGQLMYFRSYEERLNISTFKVGGRI